MIGERVNTQGSRKVKQLLLNDDYDGVLQIAQQHDMARAGVGEHAVEQLEGVQRIRAGGDAVVLHVNETLG